MLILSPGMHCDFACLLYKQLQTKLSQEEVYAIMEDAVATEVSFGRVRGWGRMLGWLAMSLCAHPPPPPPPPPPSPTIPLQCDFVSNALPVELIGMNSKHMCEYIRFCADRLLVALGYPKLYKAQQPFDWMNLISLQVRVVALVVCLCSACPFSCLFFSLVISRSLSLSPSLPLPLRLPHPTTPHTNTGQDQLLREARGRVLQVWRRSRGRGPGLHARGRLLSEVVSATSEEGGGGGEGAAARKRKRNPTFRRRARRWGGGVGQVESPPLPCAGSQAFISLGARLTRPRHRRASVVQHSAAGGRGRRWTRPPVTVFTLVAKKESGAPSN